MPVTAIGYQSITPYAGCTAADGRVFCQHARMLEKIVKEQDAGTFKSLFTTFGPKLRAMLMRQGADSETAEDIVQDTMLTVWTKSHLFAEDKGALSSWIYAIARNLRIDRLRRQIVWDRLSQELAAFQDLHAAADTTAGREQDRFKIANALSGLPTEQLLVVKLSFIDGLSQNEIAEQLKLPLGTVKSRMRLAFGKLRGSVESGA